MWASACLIPAQASVRVWFAVCFSSLLLRALAHPLTRVFFYYNGRRHFPRSQNPNENCFTCSTHIYSLRLPFFFSGGVVFSPSFIYIFFFSSSHLKLCILTSRHLLHRSGNIRVIVGEPSLFQNNHRHVKVHPLIIARAHGGNGWGRGGKMMVRWKIEKKKQSWASQAAVEIDSLEAR